MKIKRPRVVGISTFTAMPAPMQNRIRPQIRLIEIPPRISRRNRLYLLAISYPMQAGLSLFLDLPAIRQISRRDALSPWTSLFRLFLPCRHLPGRPHRILGKILVNVHLASCKPVHKIRHHVQHLVHRILVLDVHQAGTPVLDH